MYFEGLKRGEDIKFFFFSFLVLPNPIGVLNQKNLLSTLIYQGHPILHLFQTIEYMNIEIKALLRFENRMYVSSLERVLVF